MNLGSVRGSIKTVSLSFRLPYYTKWGESILVSGSQPLLGSWDVKKGLLLSPFHQGNELIWYATVTVPHGFECEYSYYLVDDDRHVLRWESGNRRKVQLPESVQGAEAIELRDLWQVTLSTLFLKIFQPEYD